MFVHLLIVLVIHLASGNAAMFSKLLLIQIKRFSLTLVQN